MFVHSSEIPPHAADEEAGPTPKITDAADEATTVPTTCDDRSVPDRTLGSSRATTRNTDDDLPIESMTEDPGDADETTSARKLADIDHVVHTDSRLESTQQVGDRDPQQGTENNDSLVASPSVIAGAVEIAPGSGQESPPTAKPSPPTTTDDGHGSETAGRPNQGSISRGELVSESIDHQPVLTDFINLTKEQKMALRKERKERQRSSKRTSRGKDGSKTSRKWGRKNRRGRTRKIQNQIAALATLDGSARDGGKEPDDFDEWLGRRLKAWSGGEVAPEEDQMPPQGCGTAEKVTFDPSADEIGTRIGCRGVVMLDSDWMFPVQTHPRGAYLPRTAC